MTLQELSAGPWGDIVLWLFVGYLTYVWFLRGLVHGLAKSIHDAMARRLRQAEEEGMRRVVNMDLSDAEQRVIAHMASDHQGFAQMDEAFAHMDQAFERFGMAVRSSAMEARTLADAFRRAGIVLEGNEHSFVSQPDQENPGCTIVTHVGTNRQIRIRPPGYHAPGHHATQTGRTSAMELNESNKPKRRKVKKPKRVEIDFSKTRRTIRVKRGGVE